MERLVFSLPGNEALAFRIAEQLNAPAGEATFRYFPDGESYVRIISRVRAKHIILVCTLDHPDSKLLPLLFFSRTAKELGAEKIILVAPYLSYMRQDKRFHEGEAVTSTHFAQVLSSFIDGLVTIDPHLHRRNSMAEIYSVPCSIIHASSLISDYIRKNISNALLIGPDSESEQWVSQVAKECNSPFIVLQKERLGDKSVRITVPDVSGFGKYIPVLVDDIISTARTMIESVRLLKQQLGNAPVCIGTHAIFAGNAYNELLEAGAEKIVTCNTIVHRSNGIDVSRVLAEKISYVQ